MIIGVPKEIKPFEFRVGLTPPCVHECVNRGHEVVVETSAGEGIGFSDADYESVGARVVGTAKEVFSEAELVVKVKEPQLSECHMLCKGQALFTYLHLAADRPQTEALMASGCTAIAYETVTDDCGRLPLLAPMSEVAGRMSIQAGAHALTKSQGGRGVLLGGVPGVAPANVVIIGGGVAGTNALRMAVGMEARVTVFDRSLPRLRELDELFHSRISTMYATQDALETAVLEADLVVVAVLIPGAAAPKLITRDMLKRMRQGAVIVDIAIDQGGGCETSRPTTHESPTYIEEGIVHYCVSNIPGGAPRTSTFALNNATLPYVLELADKGIRTALQENPHLREGLNVDQGQVTHPAVAELFGLNGILRE